MRLLHAIIAGAASAAVAGFFAWLSERYGEVRPAVFLITLIGIHAARERWERWP